MTPAELVAFRQSLGLTQEAMAERCGVLIRSYQRWEAGDRKISRQTARQLDDMRRLHEARATLGG